MKFSNDLIQSLKDCVSFCGEKFENKRNESIINSILYIES